MPLDAQVQVLVKAFEAANLPDFSILTPVQARAVSGALGSAAPSGIALHRVEEVRIPRSDGSILNARLYLPNAQPRGLLVYAHGGGWVLGDLSSSDALLRLICRRSGAAALSLDYQLAPEAPFPAGLNDFATGLRWAAENRGLWVAADAPLAVGGDSAGANLAASAALEARRDGPTLAFQLLFYPVVDADFDTPSYLEYAEGPILTRRVMQWFWHHYAPDPATRMDPRCSPLRAGSLVDLPPTLVQTAECDVLRDEGEAYARRLEAAGVPTVLQRRAGLVHGFGALVTSVTAAAEAAIAAADLLAKAFGADDEA